MENIEGKQVPNVTFRVRENDEWKDVTTDDIFANKTVAVFSLPGAFTPTCSSAHVPRYNQLAASFKAAGVDAIVCISVNDTFVMNAWAEDQHADNVTFLPDGNGEFTEGMGALVDKGAIGFGKRSWRYSMVVKNKTIDKLFIEPNKPGDPYEVSDADTMLAYLGGKAPDDIVLFTKFGCGHCARAKRMLAEAGLSFEEVDSNPRILAALPGPGTTPQVFVGGQHIGGADELASYLSSK